ncbi:MAG: hypothetical protein AB7F75_06655 [Planctomycetota bacterium]
MTFTLRLMLVFALLLSAGPGLFGADEKKNNDLLRPQHPKVQKAIREALQVTEKKLGNKNQQCMGGYQMLDLQATVEGRRCLGNKRPCISPDLEPHFLTIATMPLMHLFGTYESGLAAMLLAGYINEARAAKNQELASHIEACLERLEEIAKGLSKSISKQGSWGYPVAYPSLPELKNYPKGQDDNHSTAQYAILGLEAARSCGVEVDKGIFKKAAEAFFKSQTENGGWNYGIGSRFNKHYTKPYVAMTCVGIATLCLAKGYSNAEACDSAIQRAIDYLQTAYKPDDLPCIEGSQPWWAYSMYCVERAGVFMKTDTFGTIDWYDVGAREILKIQKPNGEFVPAIPFQGDTAFCILFLSKGSASLGNYADTIEELSIEEIQIRSLITEWEQKKSKPGAVAEFAKLLGSKGGKIAWPVLGKIVSDNRQDPHTAFHKLDAELPGHLDTSLRNPPANPSDGWAILDQWMLLQALHDNKAFLEFDKKIRNIKTPFAEPLPKLWSWLRENPPGSRFATQALPSLSPEDWTQLVDKAPLTASLVLSRAEADSPGLEILRKRIASIDPVSPKPGDLHLMYYLRGSNPFPASEPMRTEEGRRILRVLRDGDEELPSAADNAIIEEILLSCLPATSP